MKYLVGMIIVLCAGLMVSAGPTTAPSTQPVNQYCAVNHDEKIDPSVTTVYNGKVVGFCCPDCIPMFQKNPEKYLKDMK